MKPDIEKIKNRINTTDDNYLAEATSELDAEFPGADYDDSLKKHIRHRELKKKIIKKTLFHGLFYLSFTAFFYLFAGQHGLGILGSMMWALSYFAFYFAIRLPKERRPWLSDKLSRPQDKKNQN